MASIRRGKKALRKEYRGARINARERRAVWRYYAHYERKRVERENAGKLGLSALQAALGAIHLAHILARPIPKWENPGAAKAIKALDAVEHVMHVARTLSAIWGEPQPMKQEEMDLIETMEYTRNEVYKTFGIESKGLIVRNPYPDAFLGGPITCT